MKITDKEVETAVVLLRSMLAWRHAGDDVHVQLPRDDRRMLVIALSLLLLESMEKAP